ncbi:Acyl-coenzyme A thioesterase 9, mitochondrial [Strongyloides ratti]|uniref:Acyl-coenzyme A thioesterase 9, mitochondrial n=1 Tax=Strongyloides ratti TaxID=34506 RepID=A0A090LS91_STRRB|nr:Acyl-coenzyme A thioesterase 9, mitochondrial [Strongyloides ratti]CEF70468.1 Acyl-coenzyme A thioesterase 9, mitochondrial [Strongyloides ratti]
MEDMKETLLHHVNGIMEKCQNSNGIFDYNLKEYNSSLSMIKTNLKFKIPIGENIFLREKFTNSYGKISIPKILHEVDYIGPYMGFYFGDNKIFNEIKEKKIIIVPRMLTTLFFGDISITRTDLDINKDIILDTFIPYSNKSSFVLLLRGYQQDKNNNFSMFFDSKLIMVSRDFSKEMREIMPLPEIIPENEKEKKLFDKYGKFLENYKLDSKKSLIKSLPNDDEFQLMYKTILSTYDKNMLEGYEYNEIKKDEIRLSHTTIKSCFHVSPSEINFAKFLYGGEMIGRGSQLGEIAASMYVDDKVEVVYIGDMRFIYPSYLGDIIEIKSTVTYVEKPYIEVRTNFISSYISSTKKPTIIGYLNMTFKYDGNKQLRKLISHETNELMAYVNGRRNLKNFKKKLINLS